MIEASHPQDELARLAARSVPERRAWLAAQADPVATLADLADEAGRLTGVDAESALEAATLVMELADEAEASASAVRARRACARALAYLGRFDAALAVCREAADLAEAAGHDEEAGRVRLASMHPLLELGRLPAAVEAGEVARQRFLAAGRPELAARADINLGAVYQRKDEPQRAIECLDRARANLDDPLLVGHLENNRGEALLWLNDFRGAERAFTRALEAFEASGAELTAAIAAGNLADLAVRRGQLATALNHYERARTRLESTNATSQLARLLAEQADVKAQLGLTSEALAEYHAAIDELDRAGLALESARARAGLGHTCFRLRRFAEAETALAAASTGFDELGHATARAQADLVRAEMIAAHGRLQEARGMAMRAMAVLHDRPVESIVARHLLARLTLELDGPTQAEAELDAALVAAQRFDLAPLRAEMLQSRARMRRQAGRLPAAIDDLEQAVAQVERLRAALQSDRFRAALLGDRAEIYEDLIDALLESDEPDVLRRAFAVVERAKSRTLLDQLMATPSGGGEDPADPLTRRHAELRSELSALYSRLADEATASTSPTAMAAWIETVRDREQELDTVEGRLDAARAQGGFHARPTNLAHTQERLAEDQALVEYVITGERIHAFVIDRQRATVHQDLATTAEVTAVLPRLGFQIACALRPGARDDRHAAQRVEHTELELETLFDQLLAPLMNRLAGARRLVFVPHGPLHAIPFAALGPRGAPLIATHAVSTSLSASLLVTTRPAPRTGRSVIVGLADAIARRIDDEAHAAARQLDVRPGDVLTGADATVSRVVESLPGAEIIHIATHGHFDPMHPRRSGLRLHDRWLTIQDLLGLELDARVVTLSACDTGQAGIRAGDELVGLVRSVLATGARSVLTSLWRLDDEVAVEFMRSFYGPNGITGTGVRLADAVRRSQLELRARDPHPAFWAPFTLVGGSAD